jgi:hypothetical protein
MSDLGFNYDKATQYLNALDEHAKIHRIYTLQDGGLDRSPPQEHTVSNIQSAAILNIKNREGKGVFTSVNEFTSARKKDKLKRIRAIYQEDDNGFEGEFPLVPTLVIESSPGKYHRYWVINDDKMTLAQFDAIMSTMVAKYGSDKAAKDVCRILRIPGFYNMKRETPFLVRILKHENVSYTTDELVAAFPAVRQSRGVHDEAPPTGDKFDPIEAIIALCTGESIHHSCVSLALHYANKHTKEETVQIIEGLFYKARATATIDEARWQSRFSDIQTNVDSAYKIIAEEQTDDGDFDTQTDEINVGGQFLNVDWPPGRFGDLARNVNKFSRYPSREIAIAGAMHIVNTFAGTHYTFDGICHSQKLVVLASQGRGKDSIRSAFRSAIERVTLENIGLNHSMDVHLLNGSTSYTSPKQLAHELDEFGIRSVICPEAGHAELSGVGDKSGFESVINQLLTTPGGGHPVSFRKQQTQKGEQIISHVRQHCMSILHESVPKNYAKVLEGRDIYSDGSASRIRFFFIDNNVSAATVNRDSASAEIEENHALLLSHLFEENVRNNCGYNTQGLKQVYQKLTMTDEARDFLNKLEDERADMYETSAEDEVTHSLNVRFVVRVKQIARLITVYNNTCDLVVDLETVRYAAYLQQQIDNTLLYNTSRGLLARIEEQLLPVFKRWVRDLFRGRLPYMPTAQEFKYCSLEGNAMSYFLKCNRAVKTSLLNTPYMKYRAQTEVTTYLASILEHSGLIRRLDTRMDGSPYVRKSRVTVGHMKVLCVTEEDLVLGKREKNRKTRGAY